MFDLPLTISIFYLLSQLRNKLCGGIIKPNFSHSQLNFFFHIWRDLFFAISNFDRVKKTSLLLTLNGRREQPSSSPLNRCAIRDFMSKIQKIISCELLTQICGGLFTPSGKLKKLSQQILFHMVCVPFENSNGILFKRSINSHLIIFRDEHRYPY